MTENGNGSRDGDLHSEGEAPSDADQESRGPERSARGGRPQRPATRDASPREDVTRQEEDGAWDWSGAKLRGEEDSRPSEDADRPRWPQRPERSESERPSDRAEEPRHRREEHRREERSRSEGGRRRFDGPGRPEGRPSGRSGGPPDRRRDADQRGDRPGRYTGPRRSDGPRGERPQHSHRGDFERPRPPIDEAETKRRSAAKKVRELFASVDEIEVRVEKLVEGGDGLARYEGVPIFIPRSAPGDRLRVRLSERKSGFARAEIVEILEAGTGRRQAPCPNYDACGGCDLQHLDEKTQLRTKAEAVMETLRRLGGIKELPPRFEIIAGEPWAYRLRTQVHVRTNERGAQAGYFGRGSHDLVPVETCPILVPQLEQVLKRIPRLLRKGETPPRFDLAAGDGETFTCSPPYEQLPKGEVTISIGDFAYEYDARCFFQAHRSLTERLVQEAMGDALLGTDPDAEPIDGEAFDLYAGVGLFALPLSQRYAKVTAVDGDRVAIRFARRNARLNTRSNVDTIAQAVESWVAELPENAARVLVDPPRSGLSGKVRGLIRVRRPRRLTYISCQPATLARDLKYLIKTYAMESLTLLDMFPQTGHMESVVQLRLKD